jgi:hypothetical protein
MSKTRQRLTADEILNELERLVKLKTIPLPGLDLPAFESSYEPIQRFVNDLRASGKPETQVHNLFNRLLEDVLHKSAVPEANIGVGFVDYSLQEDHSNPVLIELKPLFLLDKEEGALWADPIKWSQHEKQVTKYLRKNDYVLLSDLRSAFLFNRDALGEFKPFHEESLAGLLLRFKEAENIWDAIRRIEDQSFRPDLDQHFFDDLKKWHGEFQAIKMHPPEGRTKSELIVLLLNKVIFIKTLEDYGLIDFQYLTDTYDLYKDRWEERDLLRFVERFFDEVEEFFKVYYDTELFKLKFWDYVDKEKENVARFRDIFEKMLGTGRWEKEFAQGLTHYTYRQIDEDVFGKAYETFIAEHRKDSGVYYTPRPLTVYMARKLVEDLFRPLVDQILTAIDKNKPDFARADALMQQLFSLRVLDPTSGSGSFLIKVLREIDAQYQRITLATEWVQSVETGSIAEQPRVYGDTARFRDDHKLGTNNRLTLIGQMILRHIHAIDLDERALDTAKTNTWKEAIKLRPRIYNYRRFRRAQIDHILPDLELNFVSGDSLADLPIERQIKILHSEFQEEVIRMHLIRNQYIQDPFKPEVLEEALDIKQRLRTRLVQELPDIERPAFVVLEFFFAYFDENGQPLSETEQGFNGIISNPPWEAVKPVKKEFAAKGKFEFDILDFDAWFEHEIESNASFKEGWDAYKRFYSHYNDYLGSLYTHQGAGDPNFYKLFIERDLGMLKKGGILSILVQSGFQTDAGSEPLRKLLIEENRLLEISSFDNKGYMDETNGVPIRRKLFPEVHPQFKFSILRAQKDSSDSGPFLARFYMRNPEELESKALIPYDSKLIEQFSPVNFSIMEFSSSIDLDVCQRIRAEHTLLAALPFRLKREFDMTNDSDLFHKRENVPVAKRKEYLPLMEGKMIHQFHTGYDGREARYLLKASEARARLLPKEIGRVMRTFGLDEDEAKQVVKKLDYENYRLVYRAIGRSTDERTLLASIAPPKNVIGHSMNYLRNITYKRSKSNIVQEDIQSGRMLTLLSLLNSLVLNYYLRNKVSANLTMNFIYELPIPKIPKKLETRLSQLALQLLIQKSGGKEFAALASELGVRVKPDIDPIAIRAELEVLIARDIYGLSPADWTYLTSTFTQGSGSESRQELEQIIAASKKLFMET